MNSEGVNMDKTEIADEYFKYVAKIPQEYNILQII